MRVKPAYTTNAFFDQPPIVTRRVNFSRMIGRRTKPSLILNKHSAVDGGVIEILGESGRLIAIREILQDESTPASDIVAVLEEIGYTNPNSSRQGIKNALKAIKRTLNDRQIAAEELRKKAADVITEEPNPEIPITEVSEEKYPPEEDPFTSAIEKDPHEVKQKDSDLSKNVIKELKLLKKAIKELKPPSSTGAQISKKTKIGDLTTEEILSDDPGLAADVAALANIPPSLAVKKNGEPSKALSAAIKKSIPKKPKKALKKPKKATCKLLPKLVEN